jgi:transposase
VIELLALGESRTKSAEVVGSGRGTVKKYWNDFQRHGVGSILNRSRIARKSASHEVQQSVFRVLHTPPHSHGFNRTNWRMKDLNLVLRRSGTPISKEVIREIIHSAGYQWKKADSVNFQIECGVSTNVRVPAIEYRNAQG